MARWFFGRSTTNNDSDQTSAAEPDLEKNNDDDNQSSDRAHRDASKWTLGVLRDKETDEVPGSVLLLPKKTSTHNRPLGLHKAPATSSAASLPSPFHHATTPHARPAEPKRTKDGRFILEPQPSDSANDPLNWPAWRRDVALISLGLYCMVGGGMTPLLAAGFQNVAATYDVSLSKVALTTGLYMMGLGLGSVVASPTAILWGKRPVYLVTAVIFVLTNIWCALSPTFVSLLIARIVQGFAVSPVECLPSATIAEIFFLHERAYRLGIYTLLLLSGKNLVPLVSAAIIESLDWRWVFWIAAIIVGFCGCLLFFFVPETFWDRTPHAHHLPKIHPRWPSRISLSRKPSQHSERKQKDSVATPAANEEKEKKLEPVTILPPCSPVSPVLPASPASLGTPASAPIPATSPLSIHGGLAQRRQKKNGQHVGFVSALDSPPASTGAHLTGVMSMPSGIYTGPVTNSSFTPALALPRDSMSGEDGTFGGSSENAFFPEPPQSGPFGIEATRTTTHNDATSRGLTPSAAPGLHADAWKVEPAYDVPPTPDLHNLNSPWYADKDQKKGGDDDAGYFNLAPVPSKPATLNSHLTAQPIKPEQAPFAVQDIPPTPELRNLNSPWYAEKAEHGDDYFGSVDLSRSKSVKDHLASKVSTRAHTPLRSALKLSQKPQRISLPGSPGLAISTTRNSTRPPSISDLSPTQLDAMHNVVVGMPGDDPGAPRKPYVKMLAPFNPRIRKVPWWKPALRPFILFAYPAILWSTLVYSLSIGWLIVLSETVAEVYRSRDSYNFTALQTGLVYISPFIGGVLGTAVAGKLSDLIVRWMARRNGGVYEPEFRLVMALPVAVTTSIGLMGFGWSAQERDAWIVPTVFFGLVSFGCSLGSTTSITFAVDSYRQYAGEALVTLNFSKNIFHGLVFSLFFPSWVQSEGPKMVFVAIGVIQVGCCLFSIPMYIYGKRARMWTVRRDFMGKL